MSKTQAFVATVIALCVVLVVGTITYGIVYSAQKKRDLLEKCLKTERNAQDCRNAIYGFAR